MRTIVKKLPQLPRWLFVAFAVAIGVSFGVVFSAALSGLTSSRILLAAIEGVAVIAMSVFVARFISLFRKTEMAVFWSLLWSAVFVTIVLMVAFITKLALRDPAAAYFGINRSYIEKNWKTDPNSRLIYFPLSYLTVNGKLFPRAFFVFDKDRTFVIDQYSDHLKSPSCFRAKYDARVVSDRIYIVTLYVDDPDETVEPCLVTPQTAGG